MSTIQEEKKVGSKSFIELKQKNLGGGKLVLFFIAELNKYVNKKLMV